MTCIVYMYFVDQYKFDKKNYSLENLKTIFLIKKKSLDKWGNTNGHYTISLKKK